MNIKFKPTVTVIYKTHSTSSLLGQSIWVTANIFHISKRITLIKTLSKYRETTFDIPERTKDDRTHQQHNHADG